MIANNSGKVYRFKLDHNLGYGFAEVYDFTDELSMFDGRLVYVYNQNDQAEKPSYTLSEIRKAGISLGPIRLNKFPNTRGLHSWKYLFQTDDLLINEIPETKELHKLNWDSDDWSNYNYWYRSNCDFKNPIEYIDYEEVRHLETRIINSPSGVVKKFTMKVLVNNKENISEYYDLSDLGSKNMFVQMVNTYYSLSQAKKLLKLLSVETG